ncbi:MAG: type I-F CRISPR-associated endoribonuclease Cas6/Csy4 [Candidatus Dactylopiibacterium carminicum]|uniref:Type I-F CRISPR-associated endoribonuclease Cas6/Csy4 n=1 Tax=Candidatus Dactylopiibacterium carminicum TaxID=857335 RepID=A0A272EN65_9RHOO|nr:type I-F CRISPR-associated endoribonuclease Cas6/Csy4 [Candidatus Dactylopiibacterium carminicum]KAF7597959.1 type I-F CRISPR-associated endoribonuclease Cas6/Csy4 [Candidatus Dactylopiibacterium carminicum]PAS91532.1 MAG: type I-F CRISPR-associated endoribonuclease Cas6/Csy4 [Candidatus Dactylopiibacterium carminicum]PAS93120.1 MAG: type I-F CRISPR-associated endoribonuclease Cas6/Csy4 [Candidatus Dactylopiibacterium carminicum]PAS96111.1 MAG: type I-F CRISPR-associated endoribonuclease Cas
MDHYIDLRVRPDPEFPVPQLLNALAAKLHRALVALQAEDIGVSFPHHKAKGSGLGDILRLHGTAARLQTMMQSDWLQGMADHVEQAGILPVPMGAQFRVVRRVQAQSNAERIRRRQIKRHGWSEKEARERIPDAVEKRLDLPWLTLRSQSTGQNFRLFVEHLPCQPAANPGRFNAYGLSNTATIPWF